MKRIAKLLLIVALVSCLLLALPMNASAANTQSQGNVNVTLTTDQAKYSAGEEVKLLVEIKNGKSHGIEGVGVEVWLPNALELQSGELTKTDMTIDAGKTGSVSLVAKATGAGALNPLLILFIAVGAVAVIAVVVVIVVGSRKRKKKAAKVVSVLLCLVMTLSMLPLSAFAAEENVTIAVDKVITVAGRKYTVKANVTIPAVWMNSQCVVTFDSTGGTAVESQTIPMGTCAEIPAAPQKVGYAFAGWYADKELTKEFDFSQAIPAACTLYARWVDITDQTDTDGDGLTDPVEKYLETDIAKADTDGDGLSDYVEVVKLSYDPLKADTDGNGVTDDKEDFDGDGIANKTEIDAGTDPALADTDGDGLKDNEEPRYSTDACAYDTDGDGVSDGKEVELGYDPLVAQATFNMHLTADNKGDKVKPSVDIQLSGNQVETLRIDPVNNDNFFPETMPGYLGKAYDFSVEGTFTEATISFEFNLSALAPDAEPVICYFNEQTQQLEELATTVSGNVASATVTHFSKYLLIDRKVYQDSFTWTDVWDSTTTYTGAEIILVIDDSGSMGSNDSKNQRLEVAKTLVDNLSKSSKIGVVKFASSTSTLSALTTDKETVKSYLTTSYFRSSGGTDMYEAINNALGMFASTDATTLRMLVVLSDGIANDTYSHDDTITVANNKGVKIYTVGLGASSSSYFTTYLEPLAINTGGLFYLSTDAEQLADIYKNIQEKIDIETDSDGDGIPDYYEDNMICFNGIHLQLDKDNPDTDGDGLKDGEEVQLTYEYNADRTKVKVTGKLVSGDPTKNDTDGDSYKDAEDLEPFKAYKTPIILIHGWTSNTTCFGVQTAIKEGDNSHFDHNNDGYTDTVTISGLSYDAVQSHKIKQVQYGMLGHYLLASGYTANENLYAFNYPNQDMVQYSAVKLSSYIGNLVKTAKGNNYSGITNPYALFATKDDYEKGNAQFVLIGHSMGGLVSRYYVENLGGKYITKVITIDTPHYGSGLGNAADKFDVAKYAGKFNPGVFDLDTNSTLYGGDTKTWDWSIVARKETQYALNHQSPALKGNKNSSVKYYAVAGYDVGGATEIRQLAEGLRTDLKNGKAFAVTFERDVSNKKALKKSINDAVNTSSIARYGAGSELDLGDMDGDNTVDYMSQLAVRFGKRYDYQVLTKTTIIIATGTDVLNPYHNAIHYEGLMHQTVYEFVAD